MFKNLLRLYTKISIIILALLGFLPLSGVKAHSVTESPWLYINTFAVTESDENPIPNPSKLQWGGHLFYNEGSSLKVNIDRDVIERDLEITKSNIGVTYKLTFPDTKIVTYEDDFSTDLISTGNYFLNIRVNNKEKNSNLILESVMIIVGDKVEQSKFKVDGVEMDNSSAAPTFTITDELDLKFEVLNANESKYSYKWDLGTSEVKDGIQVEQNFEKAKIPVYVVLRTTDKVTNVFADSYVRIDSENENTFRIPAPPVKLPTTEILSDSEGELTIVLIGGTLVFVIGLLMLVFIIKINLK